MNQLPIKRLFQVFVLLSFITISQNAYSQIVAEAGGPYTALSGEVVSLDGSAYIPGANLKIIGLGLHNYHSAYKELPPAIVNDIDGNPLYSWRVAILPFIDEADLYDQFELSEPWNSQNNIALLDQMPDVFRRIGMDTDDNYTDFAVPDSPTSMFNGADTTKFRDVLDGLSNTIMVSETANANLLWSKPNDVDLDLHPDIDNPNGFSSELDDYIMLLMGDGAIRFLDKSTTQSIVDELFTRAGGETTDFSEYLIDAGDIDLYEWDLDDNGSFETIGEDPDFDATGLATGDYPVHLRITSTTGVTTIVSSFVSVTCELPLDSYVMIASKEVYLKNSTVTGGGVGVMNVDKKAKVKDNSEVFSFVKSSEIDKSNNSYIETEILAPALESLPPFYDFNDECSGPEIDVEEGDMVVLTDSYYKKIKVGEGATLIIDVAEIHVEKFETENEATIEFLQSTSVMIENDLKLDKDNTMLSNGHSVSFFAGDKVEIKEGAIFDADIYAQDDIKVKGKSDNRSSMTGLFISMDKIKSDKYVDWLADNSCDSPPIPSLPICDYDNEGDEDEDDIDDNKSTDDFDLKKLNQKSLFNSSEFNHTSFSTKTGLTVYPNPVYDILQISLFSEVEGSIRIQLLDITGKMLSSKAERTTQGHNLYDIEMSLYEGGIYFLHVQAPTGNELIKVVKPGL